MHKTLNFPIQCFSPQMVPSSFFYEEKNGDLYLNSKNKMGEQIFYDALDEISIIPSVVRLVETILEEGRKNKALKQWVGKWGLLNSGGSQRLEEIWFELYKFYKLWDLYKGVANKDKNKLKKHIKVNRNIGKINKDNLITVIFRGTEDPYLQEVCKISFFEGEEFSESDYFSFDEEEEDQECLSAIQYLLSKIESQIKACTLFSERMSFYTDEKQNVINLSPGIKVSTLLEALYMQFFILLTENQKKICMICNHPFLPPRKDKKYCSNSCYLTAKSRRYRKNKKENSTDL